MKIPWENTTLSAWSALQIFYEITRPRIMYEQSYHMAENKASKFVGVGLISWFQNSSWFTNKSHRGGSEKWNANRKKLDYMPNAVHSVRAIDLFWQLRVRGNRMGILCLQLRFLSKRLFKFHATKAVETWSKQAFYDLKRNFHVLILNYKLSFFYEIFHLTIRWKSNRRNGAFRLSKKPHDLRDEF